MIESLFWFVLVVALAFLGVAFYKRSIAFSVLAAVLLISSGMVVGSQGLDLERNWKITEFPDLNQIDVNGVFVPHTAENDLGVSFFSSLLIVGGIALMIYSVGYTFYNRGKDDE
jgi:hypothetical protein